MWKRTLGSCVACGLVAASSLVFSPQARAIELLVVIGQEEHVAALAAAQLNAIGDRAAPMIAAEYAAGNLQSVARLQRHVSIELLVHWRNAGNILLNIATVGARLLPNDADAIWAATDTYIAVVNNVANENYGKIIDAAGGTDFGLHDPNAPGPKGPPQTLP